jgi:hypothetical protein
MHTVHYSTPTLRSSSPSPAHLNPHPQTPAHRSTPHSHMSCAASCPAQPYPHPDSDCAPAPAAKQQHSSAPPAVTGAPEALQSSHRYYGSIRLRRCNPSDASVAPAAKRRQYVSARARACSWCWILCSGARAGSASGTRCGCAGRGGEV